MPARGQPEVLIRELEEAGIGHGAVDVPVTLHRVRLAPGALKDEALLYFCPMEGISLRRSLSLRRPVLGENEYPASTVVVTGQVAQRNGLFDLKARITWNGRLAVAVEA
ncbi:MAG TPA: hypothetical protein VLI92_04815 [Candidatus Saccharimonadales bacterium]|nr:hypothetical protein [Candidatus Saccharimonadales bacterium]